jgi:hypothetical protein
MQARKRRIQAAVAARHKADSFAQAELRQLDDFVERLSFMQREATHISKSMGHSNAH